MMNDYTSFLKGNQFDMNKETPFENSDLMVLIMQNPSFLEDIEVFNEPYYPSSDDAKKKEKGMPQMNNFCETPAFNIGSIYDYMEKPHQEAFFKPNPSPKKPIIQQLHDCHMACLKLMMQLMDGDCNGRHKQIKLLYECSKVCHEHIINTLSQSMFIKKHAELSALICEACGNECAQFQDLDSQNCSRMCLWCAKSCC